MKSSIRWSILMAVLGFILGLGFLIPIGNEEGRSPASAEVESIPFSFTAPKEESSLSALEESDGPSVTEAISEEENSTSILIPEAEKVDRRQSVLFDVHTIAKSRGAKNTDAWVQPWIHKDGSLAYFLYCHNYDYKKGSADATLDRFAAHRTPKSFKCSRVTVAQLEAGHVLLSSPLGPVLALKSKSFDAKKGGTLSVIFAYRVATVSRLVGGENDYRAIDFIYRLRNSSIFGPKGEVFNWINLQMYERMGTPIGIDSFELRLRGKIRNVYDGKNFPSIPAP
jgi:hypothetical protein